MKGYYRVPSDALVSVSFLIKAESNENRYICLLLPWLTSY